MKAFIKSLEDFLHILYLHNYYLGDAKRAIYMGPLESKLAKSNF